MAALDGVSDAADGLVGLPVHADTTEARRTAAAGEKPERKQKVWCLMSSETHGKTGRNRTARLKLGFEDLRI
jgi:hypothetical protein